VLFGAPAGWKGLDPALDGSVDFENVVDPLSELRVDDFLLRVRSGVAADGVPGDVWKANLTPLKIGLRRIELGPLFHYSTIHSSAIRHRKLESRQWHYASFINVLTI